MIVSLLFSFLVPKNNCTIFQNGTKVGDFQNTLDELVKSPNFSFWPQHMVLLALIMPNMLR
jgi:hypothetical protein